MRNRAQDNKAGPAAERKSRGRHKSWQEEGGRKDGARDLHPAFRCMPLPATMALGAAWLVSILVTGGALEFNGEGNPIIVAGNVATCLMFVAIFACARLASNLSIRRMAARIDDGSIGVRAAISVIVAAYAIMVFWAGPGYAASCIPSTDQRFGCISDCGESMFVPASDRPDHR